MSAQGETIKLLTEKIVQIRWYMKEYAEFSTPEKNKKAENDIAQFTKAIEILKASEGDTDNASTEPSINYDGLLGTGLTAKDINGIEFGVGAIVSFNTYTPDKMNTVRKVRIRNNELWAGEIPVAMLTGERRNLQVIT